MLRTRSTITGITLMIAALLRPTKKQSSRKLLMFYFTREGMSVLPFLYFNREFHLPEISLNLLSIYPRFTNNKAIFGVLLSKNLPSLFMYIYSVKQNELPTFTILLDTVLQT